jgi:hypothetical protein
MVSQHGTAAEPAVRLTPPCGSPSPVVQRAVALVKCPVFNSCYFGTGGDGPCQPLAARIVMPSNPYEPPQQESSDVDTRRRVTRRMVFWCGIAAILLALVMFNGSHSLYVHSKAAGGHYDRIVSLLDICAIIAVVAGCVALVVCHWIPDRRRRYAWRRPNRDRG